MSEKKNYYISTAIAYTSAKPHIGNTYEIVLADAIARYKRQMGYNVYFQTGTDEHGQKIQITSKRTTREKLMAYLLSQAKRQGSNAFTIPYDRQPTTGSSAPLIPNTRPRCRRSSSACMSRATSTRASTPESTAPPANPSGRRAS